MKVLIIGLGSIAQKHIDALIQYDQHVEIFALRRSTKANSLKFVRNVMLEDIKSFEIYDFVIISNPTAMHYQTLHLLKESKVPLFIEKPIFSAIGHDEFEMVQSFEHSKRKTYIACNLRFLDSIKILKEIIANKRVNEVNVYCGSYLPDWRPHIDFRTVYSANKEMGGGVHIDLIHELDYVYWLFGDPKKTNSFFASKSSLEISAIDYANYLWIYDNFAVNIVLNYYRKIKKREIEVVTETSIYKVNILTNTILENDKIIYTSEQQIVDTYRDQISFFIEEVINKNLPFNTISEAYKILNLCIKD